mmetsp:Transcript_1148/g.4268  ORF Transcript_1148/g.4268 Transcript_1148/m.4268 type:complete len:1158 (-) Transcript_1148:171-3644(-)
MYMQSFMKQLALPNSIRRQMKQVGGGGGGTHSLGAHHFRLLSDDIGNNFRSPASEFTMTSPTSYAVEGEERKIPPQVLSSLLSFVPTPTLHSLQSGLESSTELRRVTVLFLSMEPPQVELGNVQESVNEMQTLALGLQREVIGNGGFVKELTLDDKGLVLVAGFGVPPCTWAQDTAVSACEAALAILDMLKALNRKCGIGLTTGDAFCGSVGNQVRAEYSMVGAVVNLAARLMAAAFKSSKGIFCDHPTCTDASKAIVFSKSKMLTVKGRDEPVITYRVKNVVTGSSSMRSGSSVYDTNISAADPNDSGNGSAWDSANANAHFLLSEPIDDTLTLEEEVQNRGIFGRMAELLDFADVVRAAVESSHPVKPEAAGCTGLFAQILCGKGQQQLASQHMNERDRQPSLVLVEGEVGIGKTVLLEAMGITTRKLFGDCMVLQATFGTRLAVQTGWHELLASLWSMVRGSERTKPEFQQVPLLLAVGEMAKVSSQLSSSGVTDQAHWNSVAQAQAKAIRLLLRALVRTHADSVVVLLLDGGAQLGGSGFDILDELLRPAPEDDSRGNELARIVITLSSRPLPLFSRHAVRLGRLTKLARRHFVLQGLNADALSRCVGGLDARFNDIQVTQLDHIAADFLVERSSGNPRMASYWMHYLVSEGMCEVKPDGLFWLIFPKLTGRSVTPPTSVWNAYTAINDLLPPKLLVTLRLCAVLGEVTAELLAWIAPPELGMQMSDWQMLLPALVEGGFLVERTRGLVLVRSASSGGGGGEGDGGERGGGLAYAEGGNLRGRRGTREVDNAHVASRDSLDGISSLLSYHALLQTLRGEQPDPRAKQESLLTFRSFVHQTVTHQGWGMQHRRKAHQRMQELAESVVLKLTSKTRAARDGGSPPPVYNERLLVACQAIRVHHMWMAEDVEGAEMAFAQARELFGANALRDYAVDKTLRVFGSKRLRPGVLGEAPAKSWRVLHSFLVPWIYGITQIHKHRSNRNLRVLRILMKMFMLFLRTRARRERQGGSEVASPEQVEVTDPLAMSTSSSMRMSMSFGAATRSGDITHMAKLSWAEVRGEDVEQVLTINCPEVTSVLVDIVAAVAAVDKEVEQGVTLLRVELAAKGLMPVNAAAEAQAQARSVYRVWLSERSGGPLGAEAKLRLEERLYPVCV